MIFFLSKLPEIANFRLKLCVCFFCRFEYFYSFLDQSSYLGGGGETFNVWPMLTKFHEWTLKITLYHVLELISSYFRIEI